MGEIPTITVFLTALAAAIGSLALLVRQVDRLIMSGNNLLVSAGFKKNARSLSFR
jgi:hypothetical protein